MKQKKKVKNLKSNTQQEITKVRMPKENQFIGIVEKRLGASRMNVKSMQGKEILARVPGRAKKFLWIREGDIVLLETWELEENKADLFYKYKPNEVKYLEKKGYLANFENIEEF